VARSATVEVKVGGKTLRLSNLDKVLYPEAGFTKGQVIDYYSRIATVLLPHLKNTRSPSSATPTASTTSSSTRSSRRHTGRTG
jgi:bifunctional non-homologous end joining protein LigD